MEIVSLVQTLLNIPSPTYQEKKITDYLESWSQKHLQSDNIYRYENSFYLQLNKSKNKPHLCFIGHTDTVPSFFKSYIKNQNIYGSGASDMKGGLACLLLFLAQKKSNLLRHYTISLIVYSQEENTPLKENGLYQLIKKAPSFFKSIDLGIIAEPTNNTIQCGCVGSIHAKIEVLGESCHSARPWEGENALYNALPIIKNISKINPIKKNIESLDFFDTLQITESNSEKGKTQVPGKWQANINYRFAPSQTIQEAEKTLIKLLMNCGVLEKNIEIKDSVPAAKPLWSSLLDSITNQLSVPIQAKQAWTDVAQLTNLNIPCFNFGPGLTEQAHKKNEYIPIFELNTYLESLNKIIPKE